MTLKDVFVADLKATLEETANTMADKIILESLAKHESISLQEAEFYNTLVHRVITEAAEEFVPESIELSYVQEMQEMQAMQDTEAGVLTLTDEEGNVYTYNKMSGELVPVEAPEGLEAEGEEGLEAPEAPAEGFEGLETPEEEAQEAEEDEEDEAVPDMPMNESSEAEAEDTLVEESTEEVVEEATEEVAEELTESQLIVSNLIKSLGA